MSMHLLLHPIDKDLRGSSMLVLFQRSVKSKHILKNSEERVCLNEV
jgi:hypothetical protein